MSGQVGLEDSPAEYVAEMVEIFREVRRVLRADGGLWLNLGDSYAGGGNYRGIHSEDTLSDKQRSNGGARGVSQLLGAKNTPGCKPKDLLGIPWQVAFALRADGWWLRSEIIWAKPNPMPESVTDRPTKSHEQIFLLTKSASYFYDAEAIKESQTESTRERAAYGWSGRTDDNSNGARTGSTFKRMAESGEPIGTIPTDGRRNKRSVWTVATAPFSGSHFAVFPPKLIEPCVLAGTSARGCCVECGAPWERVVEIERTRISDSPRYSGNGDRNDSEDGRTTTTTTTTGWQPTCEHAGEPTPCTVLDPFAGSFTTCKVALELGRRAIGIELNPDYIEMGKRRCEVTLGLPLAF